MIHNSRDSGHNPPLVPTIHPTAIVDRRAELADDVTVGPYAIIEGKVTIGAGSVIKAHCVLAGSTIIGANCKIGPAAYVGLDPQHLKYDGSETWLVIGDGATIREAAAIHRATKPGKENATRLGANCFIMAQAHIGHDCRVGDAVILANAALLGGHCEIGNNAFLGGGSGFHQFVRIGRLTVIGGGETCTRDVPPFAAVKVGGLKGYNAIGCKRSGMSQDSIGAIRAAYHQLHTHRTMPAVVEAIRRKVPDVPEVREMLEFMAQTKRGIHPSVRFLHGASLADEDE